MARIPRVLLLSVLVMGLLVALFSIHTSLDDQVLEKHHHLRTLVHDSTEEEELAVAMEDANGDFEAEPTDVTRSQPIAAPPTYQSFSQTAEPQTIKTLPEKPSLPPPRGRVAMKRQETLNASWALGNIGPLSQGPMLFFTHLRRTAGTTLEDFLLMPYANSTGNRSMNCMEGLHGRYYDMVPRQRAALKQSLANHSLLYRHCPFGLHSFLEPERPHTYITMLRNPKARMQSWWHFCKMHSNNACRTFARMHWGWWNRQANVTLDGFYDLRHSRLEEMEKGARPNMGPPQEGKQFINAPTRLWEYRLDDNYAVRMLCGPPAHGHSLGVDETALACAMNNLISSYSFVGVQKRFNESLCLLTSYLGVSYDEVQSAIGTREWASHYPSNMTKVAETDVMASYHRLDDVLYDFADALLNFDLLHHPECQSDNTKSTPRSDPATVYARLERFGRFFLPPLTHYGKDGITATSRS